MTNTVLVEFVNDDISEASKLRMQETFNKAIASAIAERMAELEEVLLEAAAEEVEEAVRQLREDTYRSWLNSNASEIVRALKVEKTEALENDLLSLFLENYCVVPSNRINVARELMEENRQLSAQVEGVTAAKQIVNEATEKLARAQVMSEIRAERQMTLMDKGRLETLCEGVEFSDAMTFKNRATLVAEQHFAKRKVKRADVINELYEGNDTEKHNPYTTSLAEAAARILNN
jgi:hypothetical protein